MATFNIEILNPKAKKLLLDLADMNLISITEKEPNPFFDAIKKFRSKKAAISLEEVEIVRKKRYGK